MALVKNETSWRFPHGCALNLLEWFPVLVVMQSFSVVVINLHEAVLDKHLLDDLINIDQETGDSEKRGSAVKEDLEQAQMPSDATAEV